MKQKTKEVLLKIMLVITFPWFFAMVIVFYDKGLIAISGIIAYGIVLYFMMTRIELSLPKSNAEKASLVVKDFETLQEVLEYELQQNGFTNEIQFDEINYKMTLYLKSYFDNIYVFALLRTDELTDEIIEDSTEKFWDYTSNYKADATSCDVHLIHCICVKRITPDFRSFVNSNIEQDLGRYQLPIGISFGSQTVYIAVQKGGLYKTKYKILRKIFLTLIANQILTTQS